MTDRPEVVWEQKARELLERIPGYRGYRLKEDRRDADRRVRDAVADAYEAELRRVERIARELAAARRLDDIGAIERASQAIRHFIDRVRTVTPGYGGLFGDRDVDGVALDQIRLFDESLILGADELKPKIDQLEAAARNGQPLAPAATAIAATIDAQLRRLGTRQQVIESGQATSDTSVLATLRPAAETRPPDLYEAKPGDAISILGDDHLIDAVIAVDGRPRSFRLFRIGREPGTWLLVDKDPGQQMLRVTSVAPPASGLSIPGHLMRQTAAGTGDGEIIGAQGSSGLRAVRYAFYESTEKDGEFGLALDWDGERQTFVGAPVEPLDIEVYRRAAPAG